VRDFMTEKIRKALPLLVVFFLILLPVYYFQVDSFFKTNGPSLLNQSTQGFLSIRGNLQLILTRLQWLVPLIALIVLTNESFADYGVAQMGPKHVGADLLRMAAEFLGLFLVICLGLALWMGLSKADPTTFSPVPSVGFKENLFVVAPLALVSIVLNSVAEEFIFRAYLLRKINGYVQKESLSLLICTVLFGLGHLYEGVIAAVLMTFLGLVLGRSYLKNRNLVPLVIFHSLWNLGVLVVVVFR